MHAISLRRWRAFINAALSCFCLTNKLKNWVPIIKFFLDWKRNQVAAVKTNSEVPKGKAVRKTKFEKSRCEEAPEENPKPKPKLQLQSQDETETQAPASGVT